MDIELIFPKIYFHIDLFLQGLLWGTLGLTSFINRKQILNGHWEVCDRLCYLRCRRSSRTGPVLGSYPPRWRRVRTRRRVRALCLWDRAGASRGPPSCGAPGGPSTARETVSLWPPCWRWALGTRWPSYPAAYLEEGSGLASVRDNNK